MSKKMKIILIVVACVAFVSLVILGSKNQYEQTKAQKEAEEKKLAESISNLTQINVDQFVEKLGSKDTKIILVASLTCPHCTAVKPKINELAKKLDVEISYLELSTLTEEEQSKFYSSNEFLAEGTSIPLVIAAKDNKVVDSFVGNIEQSQIESFIKKNLNIK